MKPVSVRPCEEEQTTCSVNAAFEDLPEGGPEGTEAGSTKGPDGGGNGGGQAADDRHKLAERREASGLAKLTRLARRWVTRLGTIPRDLR